MLEWLREQVTVNGAFSIVETSKVVFAVVGVGGLVWKAVAYVQTRKRSVESTKRADLDLSIWRENGLLCIDIHSIGPSVARNVQVYLDDVPASEHPARIAGKDYQVADMDPGTIVRLKFALSHDHRADTISMTWTDNSGRPRRKTVPC